MPRIRTTKPTHWENEQWDPVSFVAHLLFIGMKNFADDKGVISNNPVLIKNKVFPTRDNIRVTDIKVWLTELQDNSFLVPLQYNGKGYYVMDFSEEKIDKPQPSIIPDKDIIPFIAANFSRIFANVPAGKEGKGEERKGEGEDCAKAPPTPDDVCIFFKEKKIWDDKKCTAEAAKFCHHYTGIGWKSASGLKIVSWKSVASGWISKEATFGDKGNGSGLGYSFPDHYDRSFAQTCDQPKLKAYFDFLETGGWYKDGQDKNGFIWKKRNDN